LSSSVFQMMKLLCKSSLIKPFHTLNLAKCL